MTNHKTLSRQYDVTIADGGVRHIEHVTATNPEVALDIVEDQVRQAATDGDYSCEGAPVESGTFLSKLECDGITRLVYA